MLVSLAQTLEKIETFEALWPEIITSLQSLGFKHVIYITANRDFEQPFARTTIPELYDCTPPEQDPFLSHCCKNYEIIFCGEFSDGCKQNLNQNELEIVTRAVNAGYATGMAIPMRLEGSERFGGFSLGTSLSAAEFEAEIWPQREEVRLFCLLMHRRIEELTQPFFKPEDPQNNSVAMDQHLPPEFDKLSPREREIVLLLAEGHSNKEAAHICGITVNTAADYAKSAYRKLGVHNRAQLTQLALSQRTDRQSA